MMRFILSSCLFAIILLNCANTVNAATGDVIWTKCQDITVSGITLRNVCINLTEAENCELNVTASINGEIIISENLDMDSSPEVCGVYTYMGVTCNYCIQFADDGNRVCVSVVPVCSGVRFPSQPIGCFNSSALDPIEQCEGSMCPEDCSGHGTCNAGTCKCDTGYYGDDCASAVTYWENCQRASQFTADVCVKLYFEECAIKMQVVLENGNNEQVLLSQEYPITEFYAIFGAPTCVSLPPCQVCIGWDDLVLNSTYAAGCGSVSFNCPYMQPVNKPLGCFEDDNVVPSCFGTCPNLCSGRGNCKSGKCECASGWTGDDCSEEVCPNSCSGHGDCTSKGCNCDDGWESNDCSKEASNGGLSTGGVVAITLTSVALIGGAGVGAWYFIKKRSNTPKFSRLDLMEEEDIAAAHELNEE
mmetsp:Transcript_21834/g.30531  ORF Transcript_21834/g.30531 Transcript_21834/m.30531 type:complete len:416 (-) Transcript_21834:43-1290(-)